MIRREVIEVWGGRDKGQAGRRSGEGEIGKGWGRK